MERFDFAAFPTLRAERVVLREWTHADAAAMFSFRSDRDAQKYNSAPMRDIAEAHTLIEQLRIAYADKRMIQWAVTLADNDEAIGLFGYNYWERFHGRAEIGYDLARAYWGRGLATDAVAAILRFGFERMQLHRIESETIVDNHSSVRLLERLGFRREGVRREYSLEEDGAHHDSAVYGLLRSEHPAA